MQDGESTFPLQTAVVVVSVVVVVIVAVTEVSVVTEVAVVVKIQVRHNAGQLSRKKLLTTVLAHRAASLPQALPSNFPLHEGLVVVVVELCVVVENVVAVSVAVVAVTVEVHVPHIMGQVPLTTSPTASSVQPSTFSSP